MTIILRYPYLAEETAEPTTTSEPFNKAELAQFIKEGVQSSIRDAVAANTQSRQEASPKPAEQANPLAEWIDPVINPRLQAASLEAQDAKDMVGFYNSSDWQNVDEWLISDDPIKRAEEKEALQKDLESTFTSMLKAGKGTYRKDLFSLVIGQKMQKDKVAFQESVRKKSVKTQEASLDRARRAVDISTGALSNFEPKDIHAMDSKKMLEDFGNVAF